VHAMTATVAATVHSVTAAVAATMTAAAVTAPGARDGRVEQCKAERCARGDGQKGRFAKHDTLL
jgi:hypothetical protein